MSGFDLWTPEFCLGCDRQTEGAAYCSESCRLADFEENSSSPSSSKLSSPANSNPCSPVLLSAPHFLWTTAGRQTRPDCVSSGISSNTVNRNLLSRPTASRHLDGAARYPPQAGSYLHRSSFPLTIETRGILTSSSSHSSLSSIQSGSTSTGTSPLTGAGLIALSDKAQTELLKYAMSFDHVRLQRRCSY